MAMQKRPCLIDTDGGVDDALALLFAQHSPELDVIGVTTVAGNTDVHQATENVLRVLELDGAAHVPVAMGYAAPLEGHLERVTSIHGVDGLGELHRFKHETGESRYAPPTYKPVDTHAVDLIIESAKKDSENLSIVTLGPLTNLAEACRKAPEALRKVDRVVTMGGAFAVPGNMTPVAEFNIFADPEAAQIVLHSVLPITLVGLDVTLDVILERGIIEAGHAHIRSAKSQLIADCTELYANFYKEADDIHGFYLHDPLAVGVAIDPSFVKMSHYHVTVECRGQYTRGFTVADRRKRRRVFGQPPNCHVAESVDEDRFVRFFIDHLWPGLN